jgi:hypothetical protein
MKNLLTLIFFICISIVSLFVILIQVTKIIDKPFQYAVETSGESFKTSITFGTSGIQLLIDKNEDHHAELTNKKSVSSKDSINSATTVLNSSQLIKDFVLNKLMFSNSPLVILDKSRDELFKLLLSNYHRSLEKQAKKKLTWIVNLNYYLQFICLMPLLFLLIPWIVYHKSNQSIRTCFRLLPFSLVITASCMAISVWLLELLYNLQALQVYLGILLVPTNTIHLDALLAFKYAPLEPLADSMKLYLLDGIDWETSPGYMDPLGTLSLIYSQLSDSSLMHLVKQFVNMTSELSALYGPFLASVSLFLIYIVFQPIIKELLAYPISILDDHVEIKQLSTLTYIKQVLKIFWVEIRAFLLTLLYALLMFVILFAIQLLASAVAGVSFLSLAIWMSELLSLNSSVPELLILFTLSATMVFVLFFNLSLIVTLSFGIRGFYLITRDKFKYKMRYSNYPMLTKIMSLIFVSVAPKLLLQVLIVSVLFTIVLVLQCTQVTSIFLLGIAICITTGFSWYYFPPISGILALYKSDLLDRSLD